MTAPPRETSVAPQERAVPAVSPGPVVPIPDFGPTDRMQGWVVFEQLVPLIEQRLASGAWPRTVTDMPDRHPAFGVPPRPVALSCGGKSG